MFRLSLKEMALIFRQLGNMLSAGIALRRGLDTLGKSARARRRKLLNQIGGDIDSGHRLAEALQRCGTAFPPLAQNLVRVGEETGNLDVVLLRLADYYEKQRKVMNRLIGQLILPFLQYFLAVGVIALTTWFGATMAAGANPFSLDMTPLQILLLGWGLPPAVYVAYKLFTVFFGGGRAIHELALRIPIVGGLMRTFALGRFSWCMSLCTDSGMSAFDGVALSLAATGNAAFHSRASRVQEDLRGGARMTEALDRTQLFSREFIEIVDVAEESGQLTDSLGRVSKQYFEDAERRAHALGSAAGWAVWVIIAIFIIMMIFRVAMGFMANYQNVMDGM